MSLVTRVGNPVLSFRPPWARAWITTYLPSGRRLFLLLYLPAAIRLLLSQTDLFSTYIKSCLPLLKRPCPTCGEIYFFLTPEPWVLPALPILPTVLPSAALTLLASLPPGLCMWFLWSNPPSADIPCLSPFCYPILHLNVTSPGNPPPPICIFCPMPIIVVFSCSSVCRLLSTSPTTRLWAGVELTAVPLVQLAWHKLAVH